MSECYYSDGKYVSWTTAHILDAADAEVGPGCCDESYQRLRAIMAVAPELLKVLERIADSEFEPMSAAGDWGGITLDTKDWNSIKAVIAKAKEID